jgi:sugar/nucleoside kinase (ribokinase family)
MHNQTESRLDYLVIGHITEDHIDDSKRLGGSGLYCSLLAARMGFSSALYTACSLELPTELLKDVIIEIQASDQTTTFNNQYSTSGRKQILLERAPVLDLSQLSDEFLNAKVIHLAPVAGEIVLENLPDFPQADLFLSLQGWLRKWDQAGLVSPTDWPGFTNISVNISGGFLSVEDLGGDQSKLEPLLEAFPLLVLTQGRSGATIYQQGNQTHIPVLSERSGDPTGAGDIFATAFIISYTIAGKTAVESAHLACRLAEISIEQVGLAGVPTKEEIMAISREI